MAKQAGTWQEEMLVLAKECLSINQNVQWLTLLSQEQEKTITELRTEIEQLKALLANR